SVLRCCLSGHDDRNKFTVGHLFKRISVAAIAEIALQVRGQVPFAITHCPMPHCEVVAVELARFGQSLRSRWNRVLLGRFFRRDFLLRGSRLLLGEMWIGV